MVALYELWCTTTFEKVTRSEAGAIEPSGKSADVVYTDRELRQRMFYTCSQYCILMAQCA